MQRERYLECSTILYKILTVNNDFSRIKTLKTESLGIWGGGNSV